MKLPIKIISVVLCLTLFSCTPGLHLFSNLPNTKIIINDSTYTAYSYKYCKQRDVETEVEFPRTTAFLNIKILSNDSLINDTILKWKTGSNQQFNPRNLFVDTFGNIKTYGRLSRLFSNKYAELNFHQYKKNSWNIILSIPEVNFYNFKPQNESRKFQGGFLGIGVGFEYFYKKQKSIQLRGDGIWSFIAPIPAPFDPDPYSPWETCGAWNINLTDNFSLKRFQIGYGLNFARNIWNISGYQIKKDEENEPKEYVEGRRKAHNTLGLAFYANYRLNKFFYLGFIYRPSILELSKPKFLYEHSMSIDILFKFGR